MAAKKRLENSIILMVKQFDDYDTLNALSKGAEIENRRLAVKWMKEVAFAAFHLVFTNVQTCYFVF
jgi:hypothetical protein